MGNMFYKVIHLLYAYIIACALGALVNGGIVLYLNSFEAGSRSQEILKIFSSNHGIYIIFATLIIGLVSLPFTIKLKISR